MSRIIFHSDLNCFYASVEMMLDPSLRGKAVAVCGATEDRHGIVLAKSEKAKKAGVKTGMVNWEAQRLCKDLILVPPQYDQYLKYSALTRSIYQRYTDLVEPYGMDECWLDVTGNSCGLQPMELADEIRRTVKDELGLTVSIGVSYNKVFAKLGSDMKKPDAITEITEMDFKEKVWPLPASDLLYVGRATTAKLARYGVHTIGDIVQIGQAFMHRQFGVNGDALWLYASGLDQSRVMHQDFVSPVKSVGRGITCNADLFNEEEVWKVMLALSQDIGHKLRLHGLEATGVQIFIRNSDLCHRQYQEKLAMPTRSPALIAQAARELFHRHYYEVLSMGATWNPTVSGAASYSYREGHFTYQGGLVTLSWCVSGTFSSSTTSSTVTSISGLPFTNHGQGVASGGGVAYGCRVTGTSFGGWCINSGESSIGGRSESLTQNNTVTLGSMYNYPSVTFTLSGTIQMRALD